MTHVWDPLTTNQFYFPEPNPLPLTKLIIFFAFFSFIQKTAPVRSLPNAAQPKENTQPVHNGTIEDAAKLPVATKTLQLALTNEDDMVPVVAFKERRSLRTLTGLEEIQTHQRAGEAST